MTSGISCDVAKPVTYSLKTPKQPFGELDPGGNGLCGVWFTRGNDGVTVGHTVVELGSFLGLIIFFTITCSFTQSKRQQSTLNLLISVMHDGAPQTLCRSQTDLMACDEQNVLLPVQTNASCATNFIQACSSGLSLPSNDVIIKNMK